MAFYITKIVDEFYIHAFSRWFNPKRLTKRNKTNANMTALLEYTQKQFNLGVSEFVESPTIKTLQIKNFSGSLDINI